MSTAWHDGLLDDLGVEHELRGDEAVALCPQHLQRTGREDTKPSWSFNVVTGLHHCFSCGYSGNAAGLAADLRGTGLAEAKAWLGTREASPADLARRIAAAIAPAAPVVRVPISEARLSAYADPPEDEMAARRIDAESCAAFGVRWDDGWVLPIRSASGDLMGWQRKRGKRVRNFPLGVRKSEALFHARDPLGGPTVVVESPLDAVLLHRLGIAAVATFGAAVSVQQARMIACLPGPVLALDNDDAGRAATSALSQTLLAYGVHHRLVSWETDSKDFGECDDETCRLTVARARSPLDLVLESVRATFPLPSPGV